jgi:periplasmic glucans biosynthesis protein
LHAAKLLVVVFIAILSTSLHAKEPFGFDSVADRAKKLAAESFRAPPPIPEFLTGLSYDEYRDIRFDTKRSLWRDPATPNARPKNFDGADPHVVSQ